jgi:hypothetical protein
MTDEIDEPTAVTNFHRLARALCRKKRTKT